ncbi:MAG: hypothetical protein MZU95_08810 [Desulfomicrobium escambiense]|nr:hypothetical protein [Desulfomicrobium escambiense]
MSMVNALEPTAIREHLSDRRGPGERRRGGSPGRPRESRPGPTMERAQPGDEGRPVAVTTSTSTTPGTSSFHDAFLSLSGNTELRMPPSTSSKERLYDFPRQKSYLREWELASVREHEEIVRRFRCRRLSREPPPT